MAFFICLSHNILVVFFWISRKEGFKMACRASWMKILILKFAQCSFLLQILEVCETLRKESVSWTWGTLELHCMDFLQWSYLCLGHPESSMLEGVTVLRCFSCSDHTKYFCTSFKESRAISFYQNEKKVTAFALLSLEKVTWESWCCSKMWQFSTATGIVFCCLLVGMFIKVANLNHMHVFSH